MKGMKVHGPDGRCCGRIESDQVTSEGPVSEAHSVLSFVT